MNQRQVLYGRLRFKIVGVGGVKKAEQRPRRQRYAGTRWDVATWSRVHCNAKGLFSPINDTGAFSAALLVVDRDGLNDMQDHSSSRFTSPCTASLCTTRFVSLQRCPPAKLRLNYSRSQFSISSKVWFSACVRSKGSCSVSCKDLGSCVRHKQSRWPTSTPVKIAWRYANEISAPRRRDKSRCLICR